MAVLNGGLNVLWRWESSAMHSCPPTQHRSLLLWILSTLQRPRLSSAPWRVEGTQPPSPLDILPAPFWSTALHNSPVSQSFLLHCFVLLFFFLCSVGGQIQGLVRVKLMFSTTELHWRQSHVTQADLKLCSQG